MSVQLISDAAAPARRARRRFDRRSTEAELIDDPKISPQDLAANLADIAQVNSLTFARRPTLRWLSRAAEGLEIFSLLDIGSGQGDMLRTIHAWANRTGREDRLTGIDLNPGTAASARAATPAGLPIAFIASDVFAYRPAQPFDFIVSAQMTHHLTDAQVVELLAWMETTSRRGWFICDLHRHPIAYYGFKAMAALSRWHPFVRHDGAVSVARSFTRADWLRLLTAAGLPPGAVSIRWRFPFRFCLERVK